VVHAAISSAKSCASQRWDVKGNKRYEESYNEGIKVLREHNGMNLAKKVWSLNSALAKEKRRGKRLRRRKRDLALEVQSPQRPCPNVQETA
jgi:hypothetical protein